MAFEQATIKSLLGGLLKNRQLVAGMRNVMVMSMWPHVVGELIARKSWPEKVADGVLTVVVTSHPWVEELRLLKGQILSRYRKLLGRAALKDVEFRVGRRKDAKGSEDGRSRIPLHPPREERLPMQPVPVTVLAGVTNPEVRDLLAPAFSRWRAERDWKQEHGWSRCGACQRIFHGSACPHCGGAAER